MEELKLKMLKFVFFFRDCGVVTPLYMYEALSLDDDDDDDDDDDADGSGGVVSVISSSSMGYCCIMA
jgi:hypothetical protein